MSVPSKCAYSATGCEPFAATERFINGINSSRHNASIANSQKSSKYARDADC